MKSARHTGHGHGSTHRRSNSEQNGGRQVMGGGSMWLWVGRCEMLGGWWLPGILNMFYSLNCAYKWK